MFSRNKYVTVPIAVIMAFLMMLANSSMNSIEVDQGSKHVVIMNFTPVLSDTSS